MAKNTYQKLRAPKTYRCQLRYQATDLVRHFRHPDVPKRQTCDNVPTVVVKQRDPDVYGCRGAIALCDRCVAIMRLIVPRHLFEVSAISAKDQVRAELRRARVKRGLTTKQARAEALGVGPRVRVGPDLMISRERRNDLPLIRPRPDAALRSALEDDDPGLSPYGPDFSKMLD